MVNFAAGPDPSCTFFSGPHFSFTNSFGTLGGVWDCSAPVFPAPLQLHGAKQI
jgi:hypothetical protein